MLDDGGLSIDELGICWGTSPNPTFEGSHAISNVNSGSFTVEMTNLTPNTTYYVRTYATNSHTTAYGNEITFVTAPAPTWPNGILPGLFSVSATKQVQFSQGNLQYKASSNVWRFADNQYDFVGEANANISETYDGWIDLFGWGTSGYNHGAVCYQPWSTSISDYDYFAYGQWNADLCDQSGMADWGYNAISNGGNQENQWRTLIGDEWEYLIHYRNTYSGARFANAQVNEINGLILLPDDWNSSMGYLNDINADGAPYSTNLFTTS